MYMYINIKVREKLKLLICELLKVFSKKKLQFKLCTGMHLTFSKHIEVVVF